MTILCHFMRHRWKHVMNIDPSRGGLWQCSRCKSMSRGKYVSRLTPQQRLDNIIKAVEDYQS